MAPCEEWMASRDYGVGSARDPRARTPWAASAVDCQTFVDGAPMQRAHSLALCEGSVWRIRVEPLRSMKITVRGA
jgi:hypothetical protein